MKKWEWHRTHCDLEHAAGVVSALLVALPVFSCHSTTDMSWVLWRYRRITSTKFPSFCLTAFSASLSNLTALLPQSRDYSCYVSRLIVAPPPHRLHNHTDLRVHDFAHFADFWRQPRLANVTCAWSWRLCGINFAMTAVTYPEDRMVVTRLLANCCWRFWRGEVVRG